ncbi:pentapeptide repeat-containing protein [Klebsiella pneumoniae]|nr:pentapeptide repeat-containing protein [Klebsiella pneumoniae]
MISPSPLAPFIAGGLSTANWRDTDIRHASSIDRVIFEGCHLSRRIFVMASFNNANLRLANFSNANCTV